MLAPIFLHVVWMIKTDSTLDSDVEGLGVGTVEKNTALTTTIQIQGKN